MYKEDIELAKKARFNAYSPYSNYFVGACLTCKDGTKYLGCNIENHGIQAICAERVAFVKALSDGQKEFTSIAVVGAPADEKTSKKCMPCGYCRQFISEFVDKDFIFVFEDNNEIVTYKIDDLLPYNFNL